MDNLYQWLYDYYALPQLEGLASGQDAVLDQLTARLTLSRRERRSLLDIMENLRLQWGTEVFAIGVQFGRELTEQRTPPIDCGRLMDFLP